MPIEFACPNGHMLKAPEERAGKTGKCPKCGVAFIVPDVEEEPIEDFAEAAVEGATDAVASGSSPSGASRSDVADAGLADADIPADAATTTDAATTDAAADPPPADPAPPEETIEFLCPNGHKLTSPASLQGKAGKCPHCGEKFRVPSLDDMQEDVEEFGVDEELLAFGAVGTLDEPPGFYAGDESGLGDEIPQDAMVEEEFGPPHPMRLLFERLWREHEHGGRVRLHLGGGVVLEADFYARGYSRGGYGVVATRDERGNYRISAIQWDAVERIEVDELVNLPDGVFE